MLVLLGISTVAAALVPIDRQAADDETTTTSTDNEAREQARGDLVPASIDAGARKPATVVMRLGDQLELRVTSTRADQVEIPRLGELEDVDADAPTRFDLLPFETGTYAVRLVDAARKIGEIEVRPRQAAKSEPRKDAGTAPKGAH
jgi:hypothetical protein